MKSTVITLALLTPLAVHAATVYSNTANDSGNSVLYSVGPYTEIGDQITLGGTDREAQTAGAQFFNAGANGGTFSATLRFFNVGAPVGAQIGGNFTVDNIPIDSNGIATVGFNSLGNLLLPSNVVFTLAISNVTPGLDLGPNLFDPFGPGPGSSSTAFFIVNSGGYAQASSGQNVDNLYFALTATVPEPGTALLWLLGVPFVILMGRRVSRA